MMISVLTLVVAFTILITYPVIPIPFTIFVIDFCVKKGIISIDKGEKIYNRIVTLLCCIYFFGICLIFIIMVTLATCFRSYTHTLVVFTRDKEESSILIINDTLIKEMEPYEVYINLLPRERVVMVTKGYYSTIITSPLSGWKHNGMEYRRRRIVEIKVDDPTDIKRIMSIVGKFDNLDTSLDDYVSQLPPKTDWDFLCKSLDAEVTLETSINFKDMDQYENWKKSWTKPENATTYLDAEITEKDGVPTEEGNRISLTITQKIITRTK